MNARQATTVIASLILVTAGASLALYPYLPDHLPIHWNWRGQPDGWAAKSFAAYLAPDLIALFLLLMHLLPRLSPKKFSIEPFADTYYFVFVIIAGLMSHLHAITLLCGLAPAQDFSRLLLSGMFVFFSLLGNVLGKVRRNLWVGIRTPWTLASDSVWIATHRLAARLLVAAGILSTLALWTGFSPAICFALPFLALLVPVVESYRLYKQLPNSQREDQN